MTDREVPHSQPNSGSPQEEHSFNENDATVLMERKKPSQKD